MSAKRKRQLKVHLYDLLERAVEEGTACGWRRAHKHTDKPSEEHVRLAIVQGVMEALADVVDLQR